MLLWAASLARLRMDYPVFAQLVFVPLHDIFIFNTFQFCDRFSRSHDIQHGFLFVEIQQLLAQLVELVVLFLGLAVFFTQRDKGGLHLLGVGIPGLGGRGRFLVGGFPFGQVFLLRLGGALERFLVGGALATQPPQLLLGRRGFLHGGLAFALQFGLLGLQ